MSNRNNRQVTLIMGVAAVLFVICIILFPDQVFKSSIQGLSIWWNIVFPALLPFLIISEMLIAYGVVHAMGVLVEPLMKAGFRLPGVAGWAVSAGGTAGFPAGAEITAKLRKKGDITQNEGERLLGLAHLSNPILIVSVISVGFFQRPELGIFVMLVHLLSAIAAGMLMRLYKSSKANDRAFGHPAPKIKPPPLRLARRSLFAMRKAHMQDGRTFGRILGDSVYSSTQTLLVIGGYIMIFSVIIQVVTITNLASYGEWLIHTALAPLGMPEQLAPALLIGFFELHLGAFAIAKSSSFIPLVWQAASLGALLAWSGLSMHGQVRNAIESTDLRYRPFLFSRIVHVIIAATLSFLLWNPLNPILNQVMPAFAMSSDKLVNPQTSPWSLSVWWQMYPTMLLQMGLVLAIGITASALIRLLSTASAPRS